MMKRPDFRRFFGILCWFGGVVCFDNVVTPSKNCVNNVCTFDWTIDYTNSMVYFDQLSELGFPVVARNQYLWKRNPRPNCTLYTPLTPQELSQVITADGEYRLLFAINNQIPGPTIVVYEGATVVVNVKNKLQNEGVTIHWHGLFQRHTPWMDGVSMISQCVINPGQEFQYRFKADPVGTHWYHSHHGTTRVDGIAGLLVILPRPRPPVRGTHYNGGTRFPRIRKEFIGLVQDWYRNSSTELLQQIQWVLFNLPYGYNTERCYRQVLHPDGTDANVFLFNAGVINGKGPKFRFKGIDIPDIAALPFEIYDVEPNQYYRFRFVNTGQFTAFRISFDGHKVGVIAVDGNDVELQIADAIVISPGESTDVMIHTTAAIDNYWIRFMSTETIDANRNSIPPDRGLAILHYSGARRKIPLTRGRICLPERSCLVVNCVHGLYEQETNIVCLPVSALRSTRQRLRELPVPVAAGREPVYEYFLNFQFQRPNSSVSVGPTINGRVFVKPSSPLQTYPGRRDAITPCDPRECRNFCSCTTILPLPLDAIVQMVLFINDSNQFRLYHPIHMHGHHFHVLKVGYPQYDRASGRFLSGNRDIVCINSGCTEATWRNPQWRGGYAPGLNLKNPPVKDTVNVPHGGYVVIRFRADNPGYWFMHCYIQFHYVLGMALLLKEGENQDMAPVPPGFPTCGNYKSTNREFEIAYRREKQRQIQRRGNRASYGRSRRDSNQFRLYHPIHMHGHHFHVLKVGYPQYDRASGRFLSGNRDIVCINPGCSEATWRNPQWRGGYAPGLNLKNPPVKDTVNVPHGGYVVIRFRADNPGYWFMHCHIQFHYVLGMTLLLKEGENQDMAPVPPGFPTCGNYKSTNREFEIAYRREKQRQIQRRDSNQFRLYHPIHMHGHHFHVLKVGYPQYDRASGRFLSGNRDIVCINPGCSEATWRNPQWRGGYAPGLNLKNPPVKDTVNVPHGGYVVIRFRVDNQGYWFMHCHIQFHYVLGMALLLKEGENQDMAPVPPGFPTCGNYKSTNREFEIAYRREKQRQIQRRGNRASYGRSRRDSNQFRLYHPIHMHGHHFHVLKVGYPQYDRASGRFLSGNRDIVCINPGCSEATWRNPQWRGGYAPGLNLKNPPVKDTVNVPHGGYVVIRFRADNPGYWFMHCHIQFHYVLGMTLLLKEGENQDMAPVPPGFPTCGNYKSTNREFEIAYRREKQRQIQRRGNRASYGRSRRGKSLNPRLNRACLTSPWLC